MYYRGSEEKSVGLDVFHVAFKMITRRQARSRCFRQRKQRRHTVVYVEELTTKPTQFAFECNVELVCWFVCEASIDKELLNDPEHVADKPVQDQT